MKRTILLFVLVALLFSALTLVACEFGGNTPAGDDSKNPEPAGPLYTEGDGNLGGDGNVAPNQSGEINPGTTTPAEPLND